MKRFAVTVEKEIVVEFDENSEEFKELFDNYKEHFDSTADYESFVECIASHIARYGVDDHIEGIGYVKYNGKNQRVFERGKYDEQKGYVNVVVDTDINKMVDFDIQYTKELTD